MRGEMDSNRNLGLAYASPPVRVPSACQSRAKRVPSAYQARAFVRRYEKLGNVAVATKFHQRCGIAGGREERWLADGAVGTALAVL